MTKDEWRNRSRSAGDCAACRFVILDELKWSAGGLRFKFSTQSPAAEAVGSIEKRIQTWGASYELRRWPRASSLIWKDTLKKRMSNHEYRMSKDCILSILYIKKSRAKPPARRAFCAYASESDIHNSSFVNRHSSFHVVSHEKRGSTLLTILTKTTILTI